MAINVACGCGKRFGVRDEHAGRVFRCPQCQKPVSVPVPALAAIDTSEPDTPVPPKLTPVVFETVLPGDEPPAGLGFVSYWLYVVAVISGLWFVLTFVIGFSQDAEHDRAIMLAKAHGDYAELRDRTTRRRNDEQDRGDNARAAIICFTVAMAGLGASGKARQ